jgi:hypothetical protein
MAFLVVFCLLFAQTYSAVAQVAGPPAPIERVNSSGTLTLPAGTVIPLTLVSPIRTRSTKPGDTVRAQVAFPVTLGNQLVIPAGTYVEGIVRSVVSKKTKANSGGLQIHFTQLIYANGYKVSLDAVNTQSELLVPALRLPEPDQAAFAATGALGLGIGWGGVAPAHFTGGMHPLLGQSAPTPAPLPPLPGPPKSFLAFAAIVSALAVAGFIYFFYVAHHWNHADLVAYDSGWQFQAALTAPVTVNAAQVNAAAAVSPN